eukprot:3890651-Pyramimonas_sp.AAC.1
MEIRDERPTNEKVQDMVYMVSANDSLRIENARGAAFGWFGDITSWSLEFNSLGHLYPSSSTSVYV